MNDEVLAAKSWGTNAELIADVARLGYLNGHVLDATYGEGVFWRQWKPELLTANDLYVDGDAMLHHEDYCSLPWPDGHFDAVVFDPPYKLAGTPTVDGDGAARRRGVDARYGIVGRVSREDRLDDIVAGAVECYRVTRRFLLVKCQDQVEGGIIRWQTDLVTRAIENAGGRKADRFDFLKAPRPQPGNRRQLTARRNYSTLLVFEKPKKARTSTAAML